MNASARPLEAALSGSGHDLIGRAATLWPLGQDSDTATRAGRYLPETNRHPQRTRAALAAHIVARYSRIGQTVFDGFAGSGTTLVEAVYAGRHAVGVESDPRWFDLAVCNAAFACEHGAAGTALITWADTRRLAPIPRRIRHRVDLVLVTPPAHFKPTTVGKANDETLVADFERDMRVAISSWIPLLHPGSTVVFTSRLQPATDYLLDLAVPIAAAAHRYGLQLVDWAAALPVSVREAISRGPTRVTGHKPAGPAAVHDDVLVYQVPTGSPRRRRGR
jgi:16S rRNA G966 N2-methylase RsmD